MENKYCCEGLAHMSTVKDVSHKQLLALSSMFRNIPTAGSGVWNGDLLTGPSFRSAHIPPAAIRS